MFSQFSSSLLSAQSSSPSQRQDRRTQRPDRQRNCSAVHMEVAAKQRGDEKLASLCSAAQSCPLYQFPDRSSGCQCHETLYCHLLESCHDESMKLPSTTWLAFLWTQCLCAVRSPTNCT